MGEGCGREEQALAVSVPGAQASKGLYAASLGTRLQGEELWQ